MHTLKEMSNVCGGSRFEGGDTAPHSKWLSDVLGEAAGGLNDTVMFAIISTIYKR